MSVAKRVSEEFGCRLGQEVRYRKFPKYSDPKKFVVITLKFELCGSIIE